jgi:hypothetical protein
MPRNHHDGLVSLLSCPPAAPSYPVPLLPRPRHHTSAITSAGAARFVAVAAILSVFVSGCGSGHPSSSSHPANGNTATNAGAQANPSPYILVGVRNDTPSAVQFNQCEATCSVLHERRTIAAGGSTLVPGLNEGTQFSYAVESPAGKRLGCVYMKYEHVKLQPAVLVSSMTACK